MKLELSHIAIAGTQLAEIEQKLRHLGLEVEDHHDVPTEKVRVGMVPVPVSSAFRIELLEPTDGASPIAKFLEKRPSGGIHHVSFEVQDLEAWTDMLEKAGIAVLPPGIRKAARGRALFIHPKSMGGVLVELEEIDLIA